MPYLFNQTAFKQCANTLPRAALGCNELCDLVTHRGRHDEDSQVPDELRVQRQSQLPAPVAIAHPSLSVCNKQARIIQLT